MPERIMVYPANVLPTRDAPCELGKLTRLWPVFRRGQEAVTAIDPVQIIQDPELGVEQILHDGNHRLVLGHETGLFVPAMLYLVGDSIEGGEQPIVVNNALIKLGRRYRRSAQERGFNTFADLAKFL